MADGNVRINISTDDIDRAVGELEEDLEEVVEETAKEVANSGRRKAVDVIRRNNKVWTGELRRSWVPTETGDGFGSFSGVTMYGWVNYADHASTVDEGAVYTDKKPPVDALMPWVVSNFQPKGDQSFRDMAFSLQQYIFDNGIEGIHFTDKANAHMEKEAPKEFKKQSKKL